MATDELICFESREIRLIIFFSVMMIVAFVGSIWVLLHDKRSLEEKLKQLKKQ